jgi:phosphocarrier protein
MDTTAIHRCPSSDQYVEQTVIVHDELGLHARPAARLAQTSQLFQAKITLTLDGATVNAKSILDILSLAAVRGAPIVLRCRGDDATDAARALAALFQPSTADGEL